jgi:hypothetical protein
MLGVAVGMFMNNAYTVQPSVRDSVFTALPSDARVPLAAEDQPRLNTVERNGKTSSAPGPIIAVQRFGRDSVHPSPTSEVNTRVGREAMPAVLPPRTLVRPVGKSRRSNADATARTMASRLTPLPVLDLNDSRWITQLDDIRDTVQASKKADTYAVASAAVFTSAVSYGYVMWLLRGGLLLSGLLTSLPAWAGLDPLPVLAQRNSRRKPGAERDDSVEILFERSRTGDAERSASMRTQPAPPGLNTGTEQVPKTV